MLSLFLRSSDIRKPTTVFDDKLQTLVESLQMSVLEYQKATTKRPGASGGLDTFAFVLTLTSLMHVALFRLDSISTSLAPQLPARRGSVKD